MSNAKSVDQRQRTNLPRVLAHSGEQLRAPRPPSGLSAKLRRSWDGLWASPVAQLLDPVSDLPAVTRLFGMYALGDRLDGMIAEAEAAKEYDNATVTTRIRISTEARQLEAQLGLSPRSRLALGLALLAGRKAGSLDDFVDDADDDD